MKYSLILGILLIAIAVVAAYAARFNLREIIAMEGFALGLLFGGGLGLIIGGILGWLYKKPYDRQEKK